MSVSMFILLTQYKTIPRGTFYIMTPFHLLFKNLPALISIVVNVLSVVVMVPRFCQFAAYRVQYGQ